MNEQGLTEEEASARLKRFGFNELPSAQGRSLLAILVDVVLEPMVGLLVACALVYFFIGEAHEAIPLLLSVLFVIGISLYEQEKSERALEALRDLSSPRALVVRSGRERRIAGREVVPGDLIVIHEGDRIAADGRILESSNLRVDESLLTGESFPVDKKARDELYSGTVAIAGRALFLASATGLSTELGKIGESLGRAPPERSPLQKEIAAIVTRFGALGLATSALVTILHGLLRSNWPQGILAGLAAAMSLLPEEFPVVLTLFLSLGAWRISRVKVLTREPKAIESLGRIQVLCVDKTGTLTWNRLRVSKLRAGEKSWSVAAEPGPLPEDFHDLVEYGALASHIDAFDPVDRAVRALEQATLTGTEHAHRDWQLVREYPLGPELMAMSCVWQSQTLGKYVIASKGAPEAIVDLCHLEPPRAAQILHVVERMSASGLRVLAVARAEFPKASLPGHPHAFDFELVGLLGLDDPLREEVPAAIEECRRAGIRVVMMTGDHLATARTIATRAGFASEQAMTGDMLVRLGDAELRDAVREISVYARMVPQQKLRIVHALQANGNSVAMTGDGVNDAPALNSADVGISMGERGTDVAREASDLVLLDDRFSSIVSAIRMGRRVYENLSKAIRFIFAVHVPIAGLAVLPVVFGLPLMLFPAHIVFLELIIDPASSLAFEAEEGEEDVMLRPPRSGDSPAFGWRRILHAVSQGVVVLIATMALLVFSSAREFPETTSRALVFTTLILSNLALMLANRDAKHPLLSLAGHASRIIWVILSGAIALLVAIQHVPYLRTMFQVAVLDPLEWMTCFLLAFACLRICSWIRVREKRDEVSRPHTVLAHDRL